MAGFRAFFSPLPASGAITLSPAESHHLVRVRRARSGDPVEVIDAHGRRAAGTLRLADGKSAQITLETVEQLPPTPWHLTLAQALPKGKTMDAVVQRATELGADHLAPLFSRHSEVDLDPRRAAQKTEKWHQIALESAKQCGNPYLPTITEPSPLTTFLSQLPPGGLRLVAALQPGTTTIGQALREAPDRTTGDAGPLPVTLLVGPEGDFSAEEYALIAAADFRPVTLGPRVLRVETAACAFLAIVLEHLRAALGEGPIT